MILWGGLAQGSLIKKKTPHLYSEPNPAGADTWQLYSAQRLTCQPCRGKEGIVVVLLWTPLPARARAADTGIMQVNYTLNLSLPTGD